MLLVMLEKEKQILQQLTMLDLEVRTTIFVLILKYLFQKMKEYLQTILNLTIFNTGDYIGNVFMIQSSSDGINWKKVQHFEPHIGTERIQQVFLMIANYTMFTLF